MSTHSWLICLDYVVFTSEQIMMNNGTNIPGLYECYTLNKHLHWHDDSYQVFRLLNLSNKYEYWYVSEFQMVNTIRSSLSLSSIFLLFFFIMSIDSTNNWSVLVMLFWVVMMEESHLMIGFYIAVWPTQISNY